MLEYLWGTNVSLLTQGFIALRVDAEVPYLPHSHGTERQAMLQFPDLLLWWQGGSENVCGAIFDTVT